jgi:lipoprotein
MRKCVFSSIIFSFIIVLISCNDEREESKTFVDVIDFTEIGEIHNAGLDYILANLEVGQTISRSLVTSKVHEIDAVLYRQINELSAQYIDQLIMNQGAGVQSAFKQYGGKSKLLSDIVAIDNSSLEVDNTSEVLSKEANNFLSHFQRILDSQYENDIDLQNQLDLLVALANQQFITDEDKMILLPAMSVGKYSFQYWNDNVRKWGQKFEVYNYNMTDEVRSKIWKSDVAGGAVAGLHLWFSGTGAALAAAGPSGWTAIGMIIAGKALQASACALLVSIWSDQGKVAL